MIISAASGKGGTGKTTVALNTALSLKNGQLLGWLLLIFEAIRQIVPQRDNIYACK